MAEGGTILLVSLGETAAELRDELTRLGSKVVEAGFSDVEDMIVEARPDLVVLTGARGALELATILDDQEGEYPPKMVIVADRKELAKLRGLNREVVVSLFAQETTAKVVGQRIESLARRAARRREMAEAPPQPVLRKTALGLPSGASAFARVDIKKAAAAPPRAIKEEMAPPARPESDERVEPLAAGISADGVTVLEDELLESLPPESDGSGASVNLPEDARLPGDTFPPVSHPPSLPPAAKAQGSPARRDASLLTDMDVSSAEAALDSLESFRIEITPELVEAAKESIKETSELSVGPPVSPLGDFSISPPLQSLTAELESLPPDELSQGDAPLPPGIESEPESDEAASQQIQAPDPVLPDLALDRTVASATEAATGDEQEESPPAPDVRAGADTAGPTADEVPVPSAILDTSEAEPRAAEVESVSLPETRVNRKERVLLGMGLLAAAAGGFLYLKSPGPERPSKDATQERGAEAQGAEVPTAEETSAPASAAPVPAEEASDSNSKAPAEEGLAPDAAAQAPEPAIPHESPAPAPQTASALDNPFKKADKKTPTCDDVLAGAKPEAGKDPVHEASLVWEQARQAVVGGHLEVAHRFMCEAVALNPESAALEGLAAHYLREGSAVQALRYADQVEKIRPGQMEVGNLRGDAHGLLGEVEKARQIWLQVLHIQPGDRERIEPVSRDYSVEAGRYLRRGDLVRAELWFRRAVILDPENLTGIVGLAKVYLKLEMADYARAFCEMSLKVSDVIPEVHVMLGDLALAEQNQAEARARYERALAVRPGFFPAKRGLSELK